MQYNFFPYLRHYLQPTLFQPAQFFLLVDKRVWTLSVQSRPISKFHFQPPKNNVKPIGTPYSFFQLLKFVIFFLKESTSNCFGILLGILWYKKCCNLLCFEKVTHVKWKSVFHRQSLEINSSQPNTCFTSKPPSPTWWKSSKTPFTKHCLLLRQTDRKMSKMFKSTILNVLHWKNEKAIVFFWDLRHCFGPETQQ